MKVSLSWAQWHSKVDLKPKGVAELVEKIGEQLGEVEELLHYGPLYEGIIVVKVVECKKHPNAEKLSLCLVDDGGKDKDVKRDKDGYIQVVCGAPNVKQGMLAAWIPVGVTVPSTARKDPFILEAKEIRGEISNGMLASPSELDISDEHEGILEINPDSNPKELINPGAEFKKLYGLDDIIVDIENKMFTHRPDCFGVLGVARELAGIQGIKFESPDWYSELPEFDSASGLKLEVKNEIPDLVPRFMAVAMKEVRVSPSPIWLQAGLRRVGIKSINNVVDITNYLMYLSGQPIHAYDYDKVKSLSAGEPTLVVRYPKKGEKIALLNGKTIEPRKEAIMIATDKELVGVGGIMGGTSTEVDESTRNIIVECANFDLYSIRKTSMEHGLFTDAVTRFSKGLSPLQNDRVMNKAIELISTQAGGKQASQVIDNRKIDAEILESQSVYPTITVSTEFINQRLGLDLSAEKIIELLTNTEFVCEVTRGSVLIVRAPFWRTDIRIPEDVVEEVGRLYGYSNLPQELPNRSSAPSQLEEKLRIKQMIRETLASFGANETLNYSFVHGNLLEKARQDKEHSYKLNNALSPDLQYYRQTLTPSLLAHIHPNVKSGHDKFAIFELNKTHNKLHGLDEGKVPSELDMVTLVCTNKKNGGSAYFQARTFLDQLMQKLELTIKYNSIDKNPDFPVTRPFDLKRSAIVTIGSSNDVLGIVGEYRADVRRSFKLPEFTAGFEVGLEALQNALTKNKGSSYRPMSKFPAVISDLTLKVNSDVAYGDLYEQLQESLEKVAGNEITVAYELIDIFSKDKTHNHITFRLKMSSHLRTLTTDLNMETIKKVVVEINKKIKAEIV